MSYRATFAEHVRLCILRTLAEAHGYEANTSILTDMVNHFGLTCARDFVETQVAWLSDQALVSVDRPIPTVAVVTLTKHGHDVAQGRASVPGVKKRAPGD